MFRYCTIYVLLMAIAMAVAEDFSSSQAARERQKQSLARLDKEDLVCVVCAEPTQNEWFQRVEVRNLANDEHLQLSVSLDSARQGSGVSVGDKLLVHGRFYAPRYYGAPQTWDYAAYLRRRGINRVGKVAESDMVNVGESPELNLRERMLVWRKRISRRYNILGDRKIEGMLSAMTLGDRSKIDTKGWETYRQAGAAHVLALSGLHLSILLAIGRILLAPLLLLDYGKWLRCLVLLLLCWGFVLLTGMPFSLVRSATMLTLCLLIGTAFDRPDSFHVLTLGVSFVLLFSYGALFDVGFQLSVLAVVGVIVSKRLLSSLGHWERLLPLSWQFRRLRWMQHLKHYYVFHPRLRILDNILHRFLFAILSLTIVSACCVLFTQPLVSYYFGTFTPLGILSSLIAVPTTSILVMLGVCFLLLPPLQGILQPAIQLVGSLQWSVLSFFSQLSFSSLSAPLSLVGMMAAYAALLWTFCVRWWRKRLLLFFTFLLPALVLSFDMLFTHFTRVQTGIWVVPGDYIADVRCVSDTTVYLLRSDTCRDVRRGERDGVLLCDAGIVCFAHRTLAVAGPFNTHRPWWSSECRVKTDALLISENIGRPLVKYLNRFQPDLLIIDSRLPDSAAQRLMREAIMYDIPTHHLGEDGPCILKSRTNNTD